MRKREERARHRLANPLKATDQTPPSAQSVADIVDAKLGKQGARARAPRDTPSSLADVEKLLALAAVGKAQVDTSALKQLADHLRASGRGDDGPTIDAMRADLKQCPHCGRAL